MSSEKFITRAEFEAAIGGLEEKLDLVGLRMDSSDRRIDAQFQQMQLQIDNKFDQMMELLKRYMQPPQVGDGAGQILRISNATSGEGLGASGRPRIDIGVENLVGGSIPYFECFARIDG